VNCWVIPAETEPVDGATVIEANTGAVTISVAEPLTVPVVAVMVDVPTALAVAIPPGAIVAAPEFEELHEAVPVTSFELPSLYLALAENCCVIPPGIEGLDRAT